MNEVVFLGIFDKIANWIMGGITKALTWLFTNVISPVFSVVWDTFLKYIVDMIREFLALLLYRLYAFLLSIVYAIEQVIYSFAGVRTVNIDSDTGNILDILMDLPAVNKAFWYITALSLTLCLIFTIVAVVRSTFDFNFDSRRSVGRVLTQFFTASISFLIMPALCYGLLQLSSVVMNALFKASSANSGSTTIADSLYMMTVRTAIEEQKKGGAQLLTNKLNESSMFWYKLADVQDFLKNQGITLNARDVDLFVGFVGCIGLIIFLIQIAAVFIRRVMELMVLYIVSPFFVATMPLDDGERYNKWRRTFIGRLCMGVGMIVALNIMMIILGVVIGSDTSASVTFVNVGNPNSDIVGYVSDVALDVIIKLIFMLGCIISVHSVGVAITGIMDQDAASATNEAMSMPSQAVAGAKSLYGGAMAAYGAYKGLSEMHKKSKAAQEQGKREKKSREMGFKGDSASKEELAFHKQIKELNNKNSNIARTTNRGDRRAALEASAKSGRQTLRDFKKLQTHDERKKFMDEFKAKNGLNALKVDQDKFRSGEANNMAENQAAINLNTRAGVAKANRDKFEKGSAEWNKRNEEYKRLKGLRDNFNSLNSHSERQAFMDINKDDIKAHEGNSKGEAKALKNLKDRAANAKAVRDGLTEGTDAWKKADAKYKDLINKSVALESMSTHAERESFINSNSDAKDDIDFVGRQGGKQSGTKGIREGFKKLTSGQFMQGIKDIDDALAGGVIGGVNKYQDAMETVDRRINKATKLRDSFDKGSEQWNKYNSQIEAFNKDKLKLSYGSPEERERLLAESPSFKHMSQGNDEEERNVSNLDANIKEAEAIRDGHKQGSAKWNAANARVQSLKEFQAAYINTDTHEERTAMYNSNKEAFTNDRNASYNALKGKSNAWKMYEAAAKTDGEREHAHKMAKSYADFAESFASAGSDEARQKVLSNMAAFESSSANFAKEHPDSVGLSAKEVDAFSEISKCGDERIISNYTNADHEGRKAILTDYNNYVKEHDGERPPAYNYPSASETSFAGSMREAAQQLSQRATAEELTPEQRGQMVELASYYTAAAEEFDAMPTHAQRSQVVAAVNERYSSIPADIRTAGGISAPPTVEAPPPASGTAGADVFNSSGTMDSGVASRITSRANAINTPAVYTNAQSFAQNLDETQRTEFSSMSARAQQDYMTNYYNESPAHIENTPAEQEFYNNFFSGSDDTTYRNTPVYRTAFVAATSHEQRQRIMSDYNDYRLFAESDHAPHHWSADDPMYYGEPPTEEEVRQNKAEQANAIASQISSRMHSQRRPAATSAPTSREMLRINISTRRTGNSDNNGGGGQN